MKNFLVSLTLLAATTASMAEDRAFPVFKGPLMGQTPPGRTAEVFAPDTISTEGWELEGVFAPGMNEFYFTTNGFGEHRSAIIGFRQKGDEWHQFWVGRRTGEAVFSSDGQTMHLAKTYRTRSGDSWSDVKRLGPKIDREEWGIMRLSASDAGTYVFDDYKGGDILRVSKVVNGERQDPVKLPAQFNSGKMTAHPYIAPDESYLIWDSEREDGHGESDLYVSFRKADGSWGPAINMGPEVNSAEDDFYATVTPDGKYIMFNRVVERLEETTNIDIYWASAEIIEELRAKHSD